MENKVEQKFAIDDNHANRNDFSGGQNLVQPA